MSLTIIVIYLFLWVIWSIVIILISALSATKVSFDALALLQISVNEKGNKRHQHEKTNEYIPYLVESFDFIQEFRRSLDVPLETFLAVLDCQRPYAKTICYRRLRFEL